MSSEVDMSSLLADLRSLRHRAMDQRILPNPPGVSPGDPASSSSSLGRVGANESIPDFSEMLSTALDKVNDVQHNSSALRSAFERGDPSVDITQVMIASQKSSVAFEAVKQVRNKLIDAYRDVMNMPI